jgi:hypothetical protein
VWSRGVGFENSLLSRVHTPREVRRHQERVLAEESHTSKRERAMAKDHGPSVKNDSQYEGLRKKGMSKERAAKIANSRGSSKRGGESSSGAKRRVTSQGGTKAQKAAAGRKGGKATSKIN